MELLHPGRFLVSELYCAVIAMKYVITPNSRIASCTYPCSGISVIVTQPPGFAAKKTRLIVHLPGS